MEPPWCGAERQYSSKLRYSRCISRRRGSGSAADHVEPGAGPGVGLERWGSRGGAPGVGLQGPLLQIVGGG